MRLRALFSEAHNSRLGHLSSVTLTTLLRKVAVVLPLLLFFVSTPNLASKSMK